MRYVDTGSRDPAQALGAWLQNLNARDIRSLRFQSGYFNVDGLRPLATVLQDMAARDQHISCVLGSNGGETTDRDINILIGLIGFPRTNARVAIVNYTTGLFHPKVYYATRVDGSQTAYVGSANLTWPGVTGLNIEAGLILDTAQGDELEPLAQIRAAIDLWFVRTSPAVQIVRSPDDIPNLVAAGILSVPPTPSGRRESTTSSEGVRLAPLLSFPSVTVSGQTDGPRASAGTAPPTPHSGVTRLPAASAAVAPSAVPRSGFPDYVLFAPGASVPTSGADALTGTPLPSGAAGLIVRLNRDSARHFMGSSGTANVSIPVAAVSTLRFGIYQRRYQRPRAEFPFRVRYASATQIRVDRLSSTNVMVYGHAPTESGHGDIRLLVPIAPARDIRDFAQEHGLHVPTVGDPVMLEWPTSADPGFTATFADANSPLYESLQGEFHSATDRNELVGGGACWLPTRIAAGAPQAIVP